MGTPKDNLQDQLPQRWGKLTAKDLARLNAKREELIVVLQHWHGYGRIRADREISNWLHSHS